MTHSEAISWLFSLNQFGMKLGLENIRTLTESVGRPQDRFRSVLIAGTNGKGSTAAMLHAILHSAGVRAGLYTSPHLVSTEERIRIGADEIDEKDLAGILSELRSRIEWLLGRNQLGAHPTFFEVITCAAFVAFARAELDVAVLEVGLGGRLDATNVVSPVLSIITTIDLDHQEQLGTTLESIAREKAGVLRRGVGTLLGTIDGPALAAIRTEAAAVGAPLILASEGSRIGAPRSTDPVSPPQFSITTPVREYPSLSCPLPGAHQRANALLAIRAAELLSQGAVPITQSAIAQGIALVRWPGRLEWIDGRPPLLLDGAHNPAGCLVLADHLATLRTRPVLLFAAMRDKDTGAMLRIILPRVSAGVFTRPPMERASDPAALLETARRIAAETGAAADNSLASRTGAAPETLPRTALPSRSVVPGPGAALAPDQEEPDAQSGSAPYFAEPDAALALARARSLAGQTGIVLVSGSLFLIGAIKELLQAPSTNPTERP